MSGIAQATLDELGRAMHLPDPSERPTLNLWPEVGRFLGISKASTYEGARTGQIPTIRIGHRLLVPTAKFRVMLGIDADPREPAA